MPEEHILPVEAPTRLDQLLARRWDELDRHQIREMIVEGLVSINDETALKLGQRLQPGDQVVVRLPELEDSEAPTPPPGLSLSVAYEDEHLLVVDKPAGIPVRRSRRTSRDEDSATVPQILAERYPDQAHVGGVNRAGVVTTLGEDVSGLVLSGRDESMYRELRGMVKRQYVTEVYTALVEGHLRGEYTIDQPIGNARHTRGQLIVAREGRPAQTYVRGQQHYKESGRDYTLVYVRPQSSRMHQIRVHLSWYGFPIVGDRMYGSHRQPMLPDRLFLHLSLMSLLHPVTDLELQVESELPPELHSVLSYMRRPKY